MKIRSKHLAPIVLIVFILGIGGTMGLNLWRTKGTKEPARFKTGEFEGQYNPSDIRGSYTFSDINRAFGISVEDLGKAFGLSSVENVAGVKCKDVEMTYGAVEDGEIGTDSVKYFVALYTGIPYTPEEDTLLPAQAISVLRDKLSDESLEEVKARSVSVAGLKPAPGGTEAEDHDAEGDTRVVGKTTFQDLLNWGLSKQEIEKVLGMPMGKIGITVRDFCVDKDIAFGSIKAGLQAVVDSQ